MTLFTAIATARNRCQTPGDTYDVWTTDLGYRVVRTGYYQPLALSDVRVGYAATTTRYGASYQSAFTVTADRPFVRRSPHDN